jgi:hypothetical protein
MLSRNAADERLCRSAKLRGTNVGSKRSQATTDDADERWRCGGRIREIKYGPNARTSVLIVTAGEHLDMSG